MIIAGPVCSPAKTWAARDRQADAAEGLATGRTHHVDEVDEGAAAKAVARTNEIFGSLAEKRPVNIVWPRVVG